jgi:predicted transcriptional regulator
MAKELGITTSEFIDLVNCPLSTEDYLAKKKDRLATALRILKRG